MRKIVAINGEIDAETFGEALWRSARMISEQIGQGPKEAITALVEAACVTAIQQAPDDLPIAVNKAHFLGLAAEMFDMMAEALGKAEVEKGTLQ